MKLFRNYKLEILNSLGSRGFVSLLPVIIIALAALSTTTPLLVEKIINLNSPTSKIASNGSQKIARDPEETYKILSGTVGFTGQIPQAIKVYLRKNDALLSKKTIDNDSLSPSMNYEIELPLSECESQVRQFSILVEALNLEGGILGSAISPDSPFLLRCSTSPSVIQEFDIPTQIYYPGEGQSCTQYRKCNDPTLICDINSNIDGYVCYKENSQRMGDYCLNDLKCFSGRCLKPYGRTEIQGIDVRYGVCDGQLPDGYCIDRLSKDPTVKQGDPTCDADFSVDAGNDKYDEVCAARYHNRFYTFHSCLSLPDTPSGTCSEKYNPYVLRDNNYPCLNDPGCFLYYSNLPNKPYECLDINLKGPICPYSDSKSACLKSQTCDRNRGGCIDNVTSQCKTRSDCYPSFCISYEVGQNGSSCIAEGRGEPGSSCEDYVYRGNPVNAVCESGVCDRDTLKCTGDSTDPPDDGDDPPGPEYPGSGWCTNSDGTDDPGAEVIDNPGCELSDANYAGENDWCREETGNQRIHLYQCPGAARGGQQEPTQTSGPISGTINVLGSIKATIVKVTVEGKDYSTSKDSGDIAWKYKTTDSFTGNQTVTATATLDTGDKLTKSGKFPAGSTDADITIRTDTRDIITEKCGGSGVSDDESFSGFQYTACMENPPTTLAEAEEGKFNASEAAKLKDKGNPYCGKKAFDVYKCKDGSVETITVDPETCSKLPWCPQAEGSALQPDPCAEPEKKEACSCQAVSSPVSQSNCKTGLFCSPGRNPQIPGYACCPSGKSLCPATNTCMGSNEPCGPGQATATPIPTQFQQALGCPVENSDGTENVCSSIESSSGTPSDGIQSNQPGYDDTKTYRRRPSGDTQCVENYKGTNNADKKFCWQESGSAGQTNPSGGTGQPVQGGAGYIGKPCPANPNGTDQYLATTCESANPQIDDYYCTNDFKPGSNVWACCSFGSRFCSLNNQCVSSSAKCIAAPTQPSPSGGTKACAGGPGSITNHCYGGQSDCCEGYVCSGGSTGTQSCNVRGPDDPLSKCPKAQGFECSDKYDQVRNVSDPYAIDTCRSINKQYCLKPGGSGAVTGASPNQPDFFANGVCDDDYFTCEPASACPSGKRSSTGRSQDHAACAEADSSKPICCLKSQYVSASTSSSIASLDYNSCQTSKDCVNAKMGNACIFFGSAKNGVCKTL